MRTQEITVNLGPQHPSTHGVFRLVIHLDGEVATGGTSVLGYLHRGLEKLAESRTYPQFIPYTDRLDYLASMSNNLAYVQTVEKLMGIEVPERAEYLRVIFAELQRIASHMVGVGTFVMDLGAVTAVFYPFIHREKILDLFSMTCGGRLTYNYMRIGGLSHDIPEEFLPKLQEFLDYMRTALEEYHQLVTGNEIFLARTKGVGVITKEMAMSYGLSGPNVRASGVCYDVRKAHPYGIYDRFNFNVPVFESGDTFDRYMVRMIEMEESVKIIRQAIKDLPEGPVLGKVPKLIKPPAGEVYHSIENPKGELGFYIVSDGSPKPYRLHIRRPSFVNLGVLEEIIKGWKVADVIAILASLDIVLGEVDG
ncbi:MAG: NADH-quinone oxidoreductase subunit D [Bacillota bacterium]|uniref:NADH-quinone oxidoreductase subunit D n=1 Tax=Thermanaerosceptrum fracticalcis TaxID=1712410 RepID=A0A7G6E1H0_THEFR|nr:NADH-quinone oxidoreductase subunit D [Thermanaerosceptrum fracticalcis]MBZ4654973.1 dehydrogenase subunit [Peptococcaceae bacterium]QNB45924.1 NADH-quinone oxidoreductase subunit D [Thermanaerosceptrum fracticalcis]